MNDENNTPVEEDEEQAKRRAAREDSDFQREIHREQKEEREKMQDYPDLPE